jgi:hypothetical protein
VRLLQKRPNYTLPIILLMVGAVSMSGNDSRGIGIIIALFGIALFFILKSSYVMLIGSAGGEKAALASKNSAFMSSIVEHINSAIITRG